MRSTGRHWWILGCFFSNKIRLRQINRHEKSFDLMCILEKVSEPLLRYANPDILILETLKKRIPEFNIFDLKYEEYDVTFVIKVPI